jgi:hypothetical protein
MVYEIKQNADSDAVEVIASNGFAGVIARIETLSGRGALADGRPFGSYILGQIGRTDRRTGRKRDSVYVATSPSGEARNLYGWRGFVVRRVELSGV